MPQLSHTHRTKSVELFNLDVLRSSGLVCHRRSWIHCLLTWLTLLSRRLTSKRPFIGIVLLLFSDVNLVLGRSRKHVIQFTVIFHGGDPVLSQTIDRLLLFGCRNRDHLKSRLYKQKLLLGCDVICLVGRDSLASSD